MTTAKPSAATTQQPKQEARFRLPEPPKRELDEMTSYDHLYKPGNAYLLIEHFGNPETTLVEADRWIVASPEFNKARGTPARPAHRVRRQCSRLPGQQRLHRLGSGQAAGLRAGSGVREHGGG